MATVIKPPTKLTNFINPSIGLFGSIEQGKATDWQKIVTDLLMPLDIDIYNPRRDQWDNTWKQSVDNPNFVEQVNWELDALTSVSVRLFYFEESTLSPVTLLELGLVSRVDAGETVVCCSEEFWRKGNVDIVCNRFGIHTENTLADAVGYAKGLLHSYYGVPRIITPISELLTQPIAIEEL